MKVFGAISRTPVRSIVTISQIGDSDNSTLKEFAITATGVSRVAILGVNIRRFLDEDAAEVTLWTD